MSREELVMDMIGEIGDKYILEAMPEHTEKPDEAQTGNVIHIKPAEAYTEISKKDLRIYWITRALGMAAVVALIAGAAVLLVQNWDKIAVSGNNRPGTIMKYIEELPDISEAYGKTIEFSDASVRFSSVTYDGTRLNTNFYLLYKGNDEFYSPALWINVEGAEHGDPSCAINPVMEADSYDYLIQCSVPVELEPGNSYAVNIVYKGNGNLENDTQKYRFNCPDIPAVTAETTTNNPYLTSAVEALIEPDEADRFEQITDTSMPEPYDSMEYPLGNFDFYSQWKPKFFDTDFLTETDSERIKEFRKRLVDIQTPHTLFDSPNLYTAAKAVGFTSDDIEKELRKRNETYSASGDLSKVFSDYEIMVLSHSNDSLSISATFASEYSIYMNTYVFSPKWLYYHTIEDYEAAGIDPYSMHSLLEKYSELGLTDEAWAAFSAKLQKYAYRETYTFSLAEIGSGFDTELFEKSFYGKWEKDGGSSDDNEILLTYRDDMFTFENWIFPRGIAETDELYILPYINCGVGECYIIKKDAPNVLYKGWWNLASYGVGSDEKDVFIINSVHDKYILADRYENDRELIPGGEIGVWGLYKLIGNSAQSAIFSQFCLETGFEKTGGFNGSGSFTDENGVVWEIAGTKSMPLMKIYYIGGDGSRDLRLAVRYYEKTEFDSFAERNYTFPEPTEHYFILSFETEISDGGTVCNITRSAYSLPEQDSVEVIVDDGIEEPGPSDEVTIMEDDEY